MAGEEEDDWREDSEMTTGSGRSTDRTMSKKGSRGKLASGKTLSSSDLDEEGGIGGPMVSSGDFTCTALSRLQVYCSLSMIFFGLDGKRQSLF